MRLSKQDSRILALFSKWSKSFQVFESGQFQIVRRNAARSRGLTIALGYFRGTAPKAGHYSTESISKPSLEKWEDPDFKNKFEASALTNLAVETDFEISKEEFLDFSEVQAFKSAIQIVTVNDDTKEFVDYYGKDRPYGNEMYSIGDWPREFIFFPRSGKATGIAYTYDFDVPKVDFIATIYEGDVIKLDSTEYGFKIFDTVNHYARSRGYSK